MSKVYKEGDMLNKKKIKIGAGLVFVYMLVVIAIYVQRMGMLKGYPLNADELSTVLWGHDILHGDFFLNNWYGSTGADYPVYILLGLLKPLFGYATLPYYILSAVNYATLIFAIALLAGKAGNYSEKKKFSQEAFLIVLCLLIFPRNEGLYNVGTLVVPQILILLLLAANAKLFKAQVISKKKTGIYAIILILLMSLLSSVCAIAIYYLLIPLCVCAVLNLWQGYASKTKNVLLLSIGACSLVLGKVLEKLYLLNRYNGKFGNMSTTFMTKDMLWDNIRQVLSNIFEFFGADLWGKKVVSLYTFRGAIGVLVICFIIWTILSNRKLFMSEKYVELRVYGIVSAIAFIAFSASQIPSYSVSIHLMEPFFYYFILIFGIVIGIKGIPMTQKKNFYILLFVAYFISNIPHISFKVTPVPQEKVANYLVENGYKNGIATYWNAASSVFESKERLNIAPVQLTVEQKVDYWKFAAKKDWMSGTVEFFIYTNTDADALVYRQNAINTFGNPTKEKVIGEQTILLWNPEKSLKK